MNPGLRSLTIEQRRKLFAQKYVELGKKNARQAAILAGYSLPNAASWACKALKDEDVQRWIKEAEDEKLLNAINSPPGNKEDWESHLWTLFKAPSHSTRGNILGQLMAARIIGEARGWVKMPVVADPAAGAPRLDKRAEDLLRRAREAIKERVVKEMVTRGDGAEEILTPVVEEEDLGSSSSVQ